MDAEAADAARGFISREEQELRDVERAMEEQLVVQHSQVGPSMGALIIKKIIKKITRRWGLAWMHYEVIERALDNRRMHGRCWAARVGVLLHACKLACTTCTC